MAEQLLVQVLVSITVETLRQICSEIGSKLAFKDKENTEQLLIVFIDAKTCKAFLRMPVKVLANMSSYLYKCL